MSRKQWRIAQFDKDAAARVAEEHQLDVLAALLLVSRGIESPEAVEAYFAREPVYSDPMKLTDMDKAVERVHRAINNFERIAIYGDYDADGVTATALLYTYLDMQGADVFTYIPSRDTEGYGLHRQALDTVKERGAKLVITVDNGISAIDEALYAQEIGLDLVVTDHHRVGPVLPQACAVVDPHRPEDEGGFRDWAGVGVAFQLVCALDGGDPAELLEYFADILTIGTIADVVPLLSDNRLLVRAGLDRLGREARPGIEALKEAAGVANRELTASTVAYSLAPRINAAGRMGSADQALRLLLTEDPDQARQLAQEIDEMNRERQHVEAEIMEQAERQLGEAPPRRYDRVLVIAGEGWHGGVLGIVAARLAERYGRPCIVLSSEDGQAKGSGRSIEGFSLYDALAACRDCLTHFGGHTLAAGLGLETQRIDEFRTRINEYAAGMEMPFPQLLLDCKLNPSYLTVATLDMLGRLEPFGAGNPAPVFGLFKMRLDGIQPVSGGKHLRLTFSRGGTSITAMRFGISAALFSYRIGDMLDLAVKIERNEFRGQVQVSVLIQDMRFSGSDEKALFEGIRVYERIARGEALDSESVAIALPGRDTMAAVFRFLRQNAPWRFGAETLCHRLGDGDCTVCAVRVALDALVELGVIAYDGGAYTLPPEMKKVNLDDSGILHGLREQKERGKEYA